MHTAGTKRKKCHTLRTNTRHTAGTKRKKCHKCYAYIALTTIHQSDTLLKKLAGFVMPNFLLYSTIPHRTHYTICDV